MRGLCARSTAVKGSRCGSSQHPTPRGPTRRGEGLIHTVLAPRAPVKGSRVVLAPVPTRPLGEAAPHGVDPAHTDPHGAVKGSRVALAPVPTRPLGEAASRARASNWRAGRASREPTAPVRDRSVSAHSSSVDLLSTALARKVMRSAMIF